MRWNSIKEKNPQIVSVVQNIPIIEPFLINWKFSLKQTICITIFDVVNKNYARIIPVNDAPNK